MKAIIAITAAHRKSPLKVSFFETFQSFAKREKRIQFSLCHFFFGVEIQMRYFAYFVGDFQTLCNARRNVYNLLYVEVCIGMYRK